MRMSKSNKITGYGLWFTILPIAYCLLLTGPAFADDLHYNNILVGDRAAGMGGAYTAVADDPSGLYYNPAGIVFAPGRSFSASVNAFQYSQKEYKDVLGGTAGSENLQTCNPTTSASFSLLEKARSVFRMLSPIPGWRTRTRLSTISLGLTHQPVCR